MATTNLPSKDSPDLHLVVATPEENLAQTHDNSEEWRGALSLEAYLRREELLSAQDLTKDGGITAWMLVYQQPGAKERRVLCGCESIKKKALLAKAGKVEDVDAHGVASVFCPPRHRSRGYAGRMMTEVGKRLRSWQVEKGEQSAFSVLYSDIGKEFYKARGWQPFPSAHVSLPAAEKLNAELSSVKTLTMDDLPELCTVDEKLLRRRLAALKDQDRTAVALIPDIATLRWHHAREAFIANELNGGTTPAFMQSGLGGMVEVGEGAGRVWCYWTRVWTNPSEDASNTLHILRLVVEDDRSNDFSPASEAGVEQVKGSPVVKAIAALLNRARIVAHQSGMQEIQIWNPTSMTLAAAKLAEPSAAVVHREKESITSLQWYDSTTDWRDVDWVCNEKFGWC